MPTWIITGRSQKLDGLLYVVQADSEQKAYEKVASLLGETFTHRQVKDPESPNYSGRRNFLATTDILDEIIIDDLQSLWDPKWYYAVWATELQLDSNNYSVVCW